MPKAKVDYEAVLAAQLDEAGIDYVQQFAFAAPARKWRSDFCIPHHKLLIEVDGILYKGYAGHQTGSGMQGDLYKHNYSAAMGYTTLRFTPAMVMGNAKEDRRNKPKMERAIDTITRYIAARQSGFTKYQDPVV